ncbi:MAG: bifunctional metallophosphatase/5'-nucleotidase [Bacteroidota bacterium]
MKNKLSCKGFIKGLTAGILGTAFIPKTLASSRAITLKILHTNDVHSHIDPFPANHPKYPGLGGAEARAQLIAKERMDDPDLLLLDAGDMFQGTPYYNYFGGELELRLMSAMGYDAGTLGNHEFDNGVNLLASKLSFARFPLLNTNYDFSKTRLDGKILPFKVIKRKGIRIGLFGLGIKLDGLVDKKLSEGVMYTDALEAAKRTSMELRHNKKCDLVICLSHLGYQYGTNQVSDLVIARNTAEIDIIIGGHTHTFLNETVFEKNTIGKNVLIAQAGWAGVQLGKIIVNFQTESKEKNGFSSTVIDIKKTSTI